SADRVNMKLHGWKIKSLKFLLIPSLLIPALTWSQERYEFYNGVRQMGMGGAIIAVVNDETALLSNPAALGKLRDSFITVFDPEIEGNMNVERLLGVDFYKATDPQFVLDKLKDNPGKRLHTKAQVFPSLIFPNFGIGLHTKYIVDAEVNEPGT